MQVEGQHCGSLLQQMATGARVSNTYGTCPPQGDNREKSRLTPHTPGRPHGLPGKSEEVADGHAAH